MVVDNLIELLDSFEYPVFRQGSLAADAPYPDTFLTYWNNDESDHSSYDNDTALADWMFQVNVYSTDPDKAYDLLAEARALLKSAGYVIFDRGYDAASDEVSHTGRGMTVGYIESL